MPVTLSPKVKYRLLLLLGAFWTGCLADAAQPQRSARALAERYCSQCHLFPEPKLLPHSAWPEILDQMSALLGAPDYVQKLAPPLAALLKQEGRLPSQSSVSESDLRAIRDWYLREAPEKTQAFSRAPIVRECDGWAIDRVIYADESGPGPEVGTAVKIDEVLHRTFVGSARGVFQPYIENPWGQAFRGHLRVLNASGNTIEELALSGAPVSILPLSESLFIVVEIGGLFPMDPTPGRIALYSRQAGNRGPGAWQRLWTIEGLNRPLFALMAPLGAQGQLGLLVGEFGFGKGKLSWVRLEGAQVPRPAETHVIWQQAGVVGADLADVDRDGKLDVIALVAQERESLVWLKNLGALQFEPRVLKQWQPAQGSVSLRRVRSSGAPRWLLAQGDNMDFSNQPRAKPWHGIGLWEIGASSGRELLRYPLVGAYDAVAADFGGDGKLGIAGVAYFADLRALKPTLENFVFLGDAAREADACTLRALYPMDLARIDAGDWDGSGRPGLAMASLSLRDLRQRPAPIAVLLKNRKPTSR